MLQTLIIYKGVFDSNGRFSLMKTATWPLSTYIPPFFGKSERYGSILEKKNAIRFSKYPNWELVEYIN